MAAAGGPPSETGLDQFIYGAKTFFTGMFAAQVSMISGGHGI